MKKSLIHIALIMLTVCAQPASADALRSAETMLDFFFRRCIPPLRTGDPLVVEDLWKLPPQLAQELHQHSQGRMWMRSDAHRSGIDVSLAEIDYKGTRGCTVNWYPNVTPKSEVSFDFVLGGGSKPGRIQILMKTAGKTCKYADHKAVNITGSFERAEAQTR